MNNIKNSNEIVINSFYDGIMMFLFGKPVPPKQTKGKKQNRKFEEYLKTHLLSAKQNKWPIKGKIMVFISVSGSKEWLENVDIDNISKSVLDSIKNIVIEDDSNVYALFAEKRMVLNKNGLMVGIKRIIDHNDYYEKIIPPYFIDKTDNKDDESIWWLKFDDSKNSTPF